MSKGGIISLPWNVVGKYRAYQMLEFIVALVGAPAAPPALSRAVCSNKGRAAQRNITIGGFYPTEPDSMNI